jgi:hypothetical protein
VFLLILPDVMKVAAGIVAIGGESWNFITGGACSL